MMQHLEAGDPAGVLGRPRWESLKYAGDHGLADGLAEVALGGLLHLLEHGGADLGGRLLLAAHLDPGVAVVAAHDLVRHHVDVLAHHRIVEPTPDQPLDREDGVLGLVTACRLAGMPTRVSPSPVKATMDGVVRMPSSFSITRAFLPSMIATQLLVVPRSMPMILLLIPHSLTPEAGFVEVGEPSTNARRVRGKTRWGARHVRSVI